jgi:hypothetical protein
VSNLNRIIAIDNISRNRFIDIHANGHTNFDGENGAGKTTTLRASLLFFGVRPGNIAKAKGDSFEGFAAFYFPKQTSYLVYEYERAGKMLCVVCSANNGNVQYQFLNTAFDQSFFLYDDSDKKIIAPSAQVRINVEQKGYELSRKVGADIYAEIIQSNQPFRKKHGASEIIRSLRPRYSLPTNNGTIKNVDRVLANIFSSKASISHIQSALTDILIQDNLISEKTLKLDEQSESIKEWFDARQAWLSLDNRKDNIFTLSQVASEHHRLYEQLSKLHYRCAELKSQCQQDMDRLQVIVDNDGSKLSVTRTKLSELKENNLRELSKLRVSIEEMKIQVDKLLKIKSDFEDGVNGNKPISVLQSMFAKRDVYEKEEIASQTAYEEISKGVTEITAFYNNQQSQIKSTISELRSTTQALIGESLETQYQDIEQLHDLFKSKVSGINKKYDNKNKEEQSKTNRIKQNVARLETRLEDFSFAEQFQIEIKTHEADIEKAEVEFDLSFKEYQSFDNELKKLKDTRTAKSEKLLELKLSRDELQNKLNLIRERISSGTLFDYLHENAPGFETTIGKVINPDLLSMKGLSPTFDQPSESIYGLSINLDGIETPSISKSELHQEIIMLDEAIADYDKKITGVEGELGKLKVSIGEQQGKLARSKIEFEYVKREKDEIKGDLRQVKDKAGVEIKDRHLKFKNELSTLSANLLSATNAEKERQTQQTNELQALSQKEESSVSDIKLIHDKNTTRFNDELNTAIKEQEALSLSLKEKEAKDIEDKGFSPERINEAKVAYERAKLTFRRATQAGERVARYNTFISNEWINHQKISLELESALQQKVSFTQTSEIEETKVSQSIEHLEENIRQTTVKIGEAKHAKGIVSELVEKFQGLNIDSDPSNESAFMSIDSQQCKIKYNQLKSDFDANKTRGTSEYNILETTFCNTTNTPTRKFYEKMRNELLKSYQNRDVWWASAPILNEYIENEHESQEDLLRSSYILVAKNIADFSERISATHTSLNNLGRKLTTTTGGVLERFNAIGEIKIRVSSKLKELSYFTALDAFSKAHEHWTTHSTQQLPDDALISKLINLIDMIGTQKLQVEVDKSFLFEVELKDNGVLKRARTDEEIETLSSTGLSYLIIIAIYIGLINLLRTDQNVNLLFCVDEVGKLSKKNTGKLIALFEEHNITIYSALPDSSAELLQHYPLAYEIEVVNSHTRIYRLYGDDSRITTQEKLKNLLANTVNEEA